MRLLLALVLIALACAAQAAFIAGGPGGRPVAPPSGCTAGKLDFSQPCDSALLGGVL